MTAPTQKSGRDGGYILRNSTNSKAPATTITTHWKTIIVLESQCVSSARAENSSFGMNIRCSLFGDQKVPIVASPSLTFCTMVEYHHSSAKGTLTPFARIKASALRAASAQKKAAAATANRLE